MDAHREELAILNSKYYASMERGLDGLTDPLQRQSATNHPSLGIDIHNFR